MTLSELSTRRPADPDARRAPVGALVCDAGVLAACTGWAALARARAAGLATALVYECWPTDGVLRAAAAVGDEVAVPRAGEVTAWRGREVLPAFVARLCAQLDVEPSACLVIGGRRPLLAAAAWVGAQTVMVPDHRTPLFDLRGQRLAPDLAAAVDAALVAEAPG